MNHCLRCNEPCSATSLFCDKCRSMLPDTLPDDDALRRASSEQGTQPGPMPPASPGQVNASSLLTIPIKTTEAAPTPDYTTAPMSTAKSPQTPPPEEDRPAGAVEQTLHRLSDAAYRLAGETGHGRTPRASRLRPLHDISADIRRHSTPHPRVGENPDDLAARMPDLWPWFQTEPDEESESVSWSGYSDPLQARHIPSRAEAARIEEADIQRAHAEGLLATPVRHKRKVNRLRLIFICLVVVAIIALGVDSVLLSFVFIHTSPSNTKISGPPTLTISLKGSQQLSSAVNTGQQITLHLRYFTPLSSIYLTHDVDQPIIPVGSTTALIRSDQNGNADVDTIIDASWQPGFHIVQAEDRVTHYTASATLQITNGHTQPSHLKVKTTTINMGTAPQGANSTLPFRLMNEGTGTISWSANSNQPWLLLTPNQGTFSQSQVVVIGVQRASLKPGDYRGKIIFTSNVGDHIDVTVTMAVQPLSADAPVLEITPVLLSFVAYDNGSNPAEQYLTLSNPGKRAFNWTLVNNSPTSLSSANALFRPMNQAGTWLGLSQSSGSIVPGATAQIGVMVQSQNLLPGTYINTLIFNADSGTIDSPQSVTVSLTVQPSCGLTLNTGSLSFTAVAGSGQNSPSNQALSLSASSSCPGEVNWQASTSAGWLLVTPGSGQITQNTNNATGMANTVVTVGVNTQNLTAGTYTGTITIAVVGGQNSQTVLVTLTVQPPPPPSAPVMAVSQLSLNFSTTQGQSSPPGQAITITNTASSGDLLRWTTRVTSLASLWLNALPATGTVAPGQTGQVTVVVNTSSLTPGTYAGQITLIGTDNSTGKTAGGSPQTIMVNLTVLPPCTLAPPSSSTLSFSTTAGSNPSPQSLTLTASGNCSWPLSWQASVPSSVSWLTVTPATGGTLTASGQTASLVVLPAAVGLAAGTYTTQITISASDSTSTPAQGSPQSITVTLTVVQPCTLQANPTGVSLTMPQGASVSPTQIVALSETGSCAFPVSWAAASDSHSVSWLVISPITGSDNGNGSSFSVSVNTATALAPGTYTGTITLNASGTGGASVGNSPLKLPVSLVVTGYSVSGVVDACATSSCTTSSPLANATVNLVNSVGTIIATVTANNVGAFSITNVAAGTYSITVTGTDSSGNQYTGSLTGVTVSQNTTGLTVDTYVNPLTPTG